MIWRQQGIRLNLIAGAAPPSASASGGATKAEAPSSMPHPQQSQWNAFKAGSCVSRPLCILTIRDDEVVMIQPAPAYAARCVS